MKYYSEKAKTIMTLSPLISAKDICVNYQGKSVLDHISLDINEHDFVTVIGPNGAGKSVLLSCLMKLTPLTSGHISSQENLTIGYVPQAFHADISLPMTVERFLLLGKHRRSFAHIDNFAEHYQQTIDNTDIGDNLKKPLNILSGGEMQRVLVARALINQPQLLVLDEPAQNLDVAGQLAFYKLIDNLYQSSNISILMVSHELHLVDGIYATRYLPL
jgi:ABC-type Mn/Zn transport systems, ATPase component